MNAQDKLAQALTALHTGLVDTCLEILQSKEYTPAHLAVMVRLLRDNGMIAGPNHRSMKDLVGAFKAEFPSDRDILSELN